MSELGPTPGPKPGPARSDWDALGDRLTTRSLGRVHEHHRQIGSTNDRALQWLEQGAPHGALVTAAAQEAGRGRLGRRWSSPPEGDLYASLILRPGPVQAQIGALGLAIGAGLHAGLRRICGDVLPAMTLKWPNDLMVGDVKIAGILCEARWQRGEPEIVVGVGLNVGRVSFDDELIGHATSLALLLAPDRAPPLIDLLAGLLGALEPILERFWLGGFPAIRRDYEPHCSLIGREVCVPVTRPDGAIERIFATALGLDDDGALRVRSLGGGGPFRVESADVWVSDV